MVRKVLYPAVFVFVALVASQAFASWNWNDLYTVTPEVDGYDGQLYMPDGTTLVPMGSLVQFVLDTDSNGFWDPLTYFDTNMSGKIDSPVECSALTAWINTGANPAAFSDDVLLTASNWDGTTTLIADGIVEVAPIDPYLINVGATGDHFAWRGWNLSPSEMTAFVGGAELWYTDGTEKGTYIGQDPAYAYDGWTVGTPALIPVTGWTGHNGFFGIEVMMNVDTGDPEYRTQNVLDKDLTCAEEPVVPEPGTMLLIGSSALLLVLRRKK